MRITMKKGKKKSNNLKMRIKPYTAGRNQIEVKKPPFTVKGQFTIPPNCML